MTSLKHGDLTAQKVSQRIGGAVATRAALAATPSAPRVDGQIFVCREDSSVWTFSSTNEEAASSDVLVPDEGPGRFVLSASRPSNFAAQINGESIEDDYEEPTGATGTGTGMSSLGAFSFSFTKAYDDDEFSGTETRTFANGTLSLEFTGRIGADGAFVQTSTIVGGTGDFANATGSSTLVGQSADLAWSLGSQALEGQFAWSATETGTIHLAEPA